MKNFKKIIVFVFSLSVILSFAACKKIETGNKPGSLSLNANSVGQTSTTAQNNTDDEPIDCIVVLNNEKTTIKGDGASFSDGTLSIVKSGNYDVSGYLTSGKIVVNAVGEEKVKIYLDGVTIHSEDDAPIFVENCPKETKIILVSGTTSKLSSAARDDGNAKAVVHSKDDIEITGDGKLNIVSENLCGIYSNNDIQIKSTTVEIFAKKDGIKAKENILISDAKLEVNTEADGIRAKYEESDLAKGEIQILDSEISVTSTLDSIRATGNVILEDSKINLVSGGGSTDDVLVNDKVEFFGFENNENTQKTDSSKGIKTDKTIKIDNSTINADCLDNCLNSDENVEINSGTITLSSNKKGINAEFFVEIKGGETTVSRSTEGIEGRSVVVSDGILSIVSADDGINASSDNADAAISISGGKIYINSSGDGLDSNGTLSISGGETYVFGPTSGNNSAIDYEKSASITGGKILAVGSRGMVRGFGDCASINANVDISKSTLVTIFDENKNRLLAFVAPKDIENILFFCDGMTEGKSFDIQINGSNSGEVFNGVYQNGKTSDSTLLQTVEAKIGSMNPNHDFGGKGGPNDFHGKPPKNDGAPPQFR